MSRIKISCIKTICLHIAIPAVLLGVALIPKFVSWSARSIEISRSRLKVRYPNRRPAQ
jgi:hypothetical protein